MRNNLLLALTILFGLIMVNAGLNKFFQYMPVPEMTEEQMALFSAFGKIKWLFPLVGFIEVVGGVLIAIPKLRALGAIIILPVMVGIIVHHITHDPATMSLPLGMFIINIWVIVVNKEKYLPMVNRDSHK